MSFDRKSSKFNLEIESEEAGYAIIYVPWLHYRTSDESEELSVEVSVSRGTWSLDGQFLTWQYERGGKLEVQRAGGALSPERLGTIVK
jgi:hypothetical protein